MEPSDIDDAAMFLLHLRLQRQQVAGMPGELAPKTVDDAYDVQDALHRFAGWPIDVFKVGCNSEIAQQILGIPHSIGGRIPAEARFDAGATVDASFFAATPLVECEFALRLDADGNVDAVAPAIELVNSRFVDSSKVSAPSLIADNSAGCGVVLGDAMPIEDAGDLLAHPVTLTAGDGEVLASGSAAALVGGPAGSVDWTLAHETARGREIPAATWIITGTCTGLTPTEPGATYTADFGPVGSVSFSLGV